MKIAPTKTQNTKIKTAKIAFQPVVRFEKSGFLFPNSARRILARSMVLGAIALLFQTANAQNATSMAQVQSVFVRRTQGNAFFNRSLQAELRKRGLRFTSNPRRADAHLDTSGSGLRDGGFAGQMTFIGRSGKILQRETVRRPASSRAMAFRSLAQKARVNSRKR